MATAEDVVLSAAKTTDTTFTITKSVDVIYDVDQITKEMEVISNQITLLQSQLDARQTLLDTATSLGVKSSIQIRGSKV